MTFVIVGPAGCRRVNGRKRLFAVLDAMGEDERAAVVVRSGGEQARGSVVYVTLSYRYGEGWGKHDALDGRLVG